ncbi:MAG: TetR/AcrR family transcriptional regulator [Clostridia bacterium]|nr:TetR/AcrR family transcriptional regulator [Clostridia bacterium]
MYQKEDLRIKKTKLALTDAFTELMAQETFENVNVNQLCDKAGIRRATFYKHFSDKYDFLTYYIKALRVSFDSKAEVKHTPPIDAKYFVDYAKRIVSFIEENEAIFSNVLKSNLFHVIFNAITDQNYRDTKDRLLLATNAGLRLPASAETTVGMITGGVATTIYIWLVSGKPTSAEQLSEELGHFITLMLEGK